MPEIAFSLSDTLKYQYAYMVSEIRNSSENVALREENYHVKRCKDYIITHLHGRLSLSQIAEELSLNNCYLSDLFLRCEGITITEFIKKIKSIWCKSF